MSREQARNTLLPIYLPELVEQYLDQAEQLYGAEYWSELDEEALLADAALFARALAMEGPNAR